MVFNYVDVLEGAPCIAMPVEKGLKDEGSSSTKDGDTAIVLVKDPHH
jgi:hypothetical protein